MTTNPDSMPSASLQVLLDAGSIECAEPDVCTEAFVHTFCKATLQAQSLLDLKQVSQVEVSVQVVGRDEMQSLNRQYRQKEGATNILSFESGLPVMMLDGDEQIGGMLALGDLVLCREVIDSEAREQSKSQAAHWAHMLVHGTLHLCGYDHEEEHQASAMESLEIQLLSKAGFGNPYGSSE